jgi:hypothetical protein
MIRPAEEMSCAYDRASPAAMVFALEKARLMSDRPPAVSFHMCAPNIVIADVPAVMVICGPVVVRLT